MPLVDIVSGIVWLSFASADSPCCETGYAVRSYGYCLTRWQPACFARGRYGGTGTPSTAWLTGGRPRFYIALLFGRIRCGMNAGLTSLHGFPSTSHWKGRLLDGSQPVPGRKAMGAPGCSGEAQRPWHDRNDSSPSHAAANSRQPLSQLQRDHRHECERNDYEEAPAFH